MKAYSLDLRQKIVDAYAVGDISQRKLAKNFGVTLAFVQKLLKRQREEGTIAAKVRTEQTPTKLNADQLEVLRQLVEEQPDATLEELRQRLYQKTEVLIGVATVDRMVRVKLNLRFKKKSLHPTKKETDEVQLERFEYWKLLKGIPVKDLVFLDECGVNLSFIRKCARALEGKRAYSKKPHRKGKNVSVIGAISINGLLDQWSALGSVDALTFDAFISQKLVPKLWKGAVVIMDNCSIHKSDELEAIITKAGARLIYLPPYSPDFSPIENCWSKVKNILRRIGARTYADLLQALDTAFAEVTIENLVAWFTHCCYCATEG